MLKGNLLNAPSCRFQDFRRRMASDESGLSIIEILGYFMIVGIFMAGLAALINQGESKSNLSVGTNNLSTVATNTQDLFQEASDYSDLDNSMAKKAGVFPESMLNGSTVENTWAGSVTLSPASDPSDFTIEEAGIPQTPCVSLAKGFDGWQELRVGGTTVQSVTDATSACAEGTNTLTFVAE